MRVAIMALVFSIAALGFGSFATFTSLNNDETTPILESGWSEAECRKARDSIGEVQLFSCRVNHDCTPYVDLLKAINDNCSELMPWSEAECEQARRDLEQIARTGPACAGSSTPRCEQYFDLAQAIVDHCP